MINGNLERNYDENLEMVISTNVLYDLTKRLFDILGSLIGIIITLPVMVVFCVLVALETPGSPLYTQERLGKNGKKFSIFKIRSMYCDAEISGAKWASKNDARITRIGKIIRKTRIDELPQLYNILLGSMSIVGPRPERLIFTEEFERKIPGFKNRLLVKPGLTGWAQVNGGYEIEPQEKLIYDLFYIKNCNFLFDAKIILMTVKVVITGEGAR